MAALRSHASECAAEAERAQRSALQSDAVHAASSAEEVAQLREQVPFGLWGGGERGKEEALACEQLLDAIQLSRAAQAIRWERSLQDERQQLHAAREQAAAAAQKHGDGMRQMGNRLACAEEAAAAAEVRAQACERDAAARALQDEGIMRGWRPLFQLSGYLLTCM